MECAWGDSFASGEAKIISNKRTFEFRISSNKCQDLKKYHPLISATPFHIHIKVSPAL